MTTDGAVKKKLNDAPPLVVNKAVTPAPLGPYVGTTKSVVRPADCPTAFLTVTVQETSSLTRTSVVEPLACPTHDSTDAAVGVPNTVNE